MSNNDMIRRGDALRISANRALSSKDATAAIAALPAATVRVKPLAWDNDEPSCVSLCPFGEYVVQDEDVDGWGLWTPDQIDGDDAFAFYTSHEAAKAAAQADYEARIRSALE